MPVRYTDNDPATIYDEQDGFETFAKKWHIENDCDMYDDWREAYDDEEFAELEKSDIDAEVEDHKEWRCNQAWEYFKKHGND